MVIPVHERHRLREGLLSQRFECSCQHAAILFGEHEVEVLHCEPLGHELELTLQHRIIVRRELGGRVTAAQLQGAQRTEGLPIEHIGAGTILLAAWIVAAAMGPAAHGRIAGFMGSWLGQLMLFGWSVALFYHLLNGIRHLFWDAGRGFDLPTMEKSGKAVVAGTVVLTALAWILAKAS